MAFENLSDREKKVLACLITHYVTSADPVGSRVIANKFRLGISSATIRNTMQDLEEMGLVLQPHTSAGRIPTDAGYRLFVDMLLGEEDLTETEKRAIQETISAQFGGIDSVLDQTSRVLAQLSSQLGITITPHIEDSVLSRIELIHMSEGKILVVLAFSSGLARTILLEIEASISLPELNAMSRVLNEKLSGLSLGKIRKSVQQRLAGTGGNPRLLRLFLDDDSEVWRSDSGTRLHVGGAENLIMQPEFSNKEKLTEIIRLINSPQGLIENLRSGDLKDSGIVITIGAENKSREIQSCSVVSATYNAGQTRGTIGVIGPTRMPYGKLTSLIKYAAQQLSKVLRNK